MKRFCIIFLILILFLLTPIIKNSTKRIDDMIFSSEENIRYLKKDYENVVLEYDYLSSAEKLLEFQELYFEDKLIQKDINDLSVMITEFNNLKIEKFKFYYEQ
tara:strand:- start:137 stop:445 length:309 start_codon:yes stop_codon:yes gene_type:complete